VLEELERVDDVAYLSKLVETDLGNGHMVQYVRAHH
jgi:hypothetical protein